jgi:hypothetical protein
VDSLVLELLEIFEEHYTGVLIKVKLATMLPWHLDRELWNGNYFADIDRN